LVDTLLPTIQSALDRANVCVELLDARDPPTFRSAFLENAILEGSQSTVGKAKGWQDKLLIVLNKADLVPREAAEAWLRAIKEEFKGNKNVQVCLFKSSMTNTGQKATATTGLNPGIPIGKDGLVSILRTWASEKAAADKKQKKAPAPEDEGLVISVLGQPNVGKSSFINTLLGRPVHPTAATAKTSGTVPTTLTPSESVLPLAVSGPTRISIIDTPGWEFNPPDVDAEMERQEDAEAIEEQSAIWDELEQLVARDMLTRNLGRIDKVKDAYPLGEFRVTVIHCSMLTGPQSSNSSSVPIARI
jgi:nuclear GTP-binding protein